MAGSTNEIYAANAQALQDAYPEIVLEGLVSSGGIIAEDCKNGQKTFKVNAGGKYKYAHSKYDPVKEAEKLNAAVELKRNTKIIVYGLGFAYHIEELAGKLGEGNSVYVIEPYCDIFYELIRNRDISGLINNDKVKILLGDSEKHIADSFSSLFNWQDVENILYMHLPVYPEMDTEKYKNFMKTFRDCFARIRVDANTIVRFLDQWHQTSYNNLKYLDGTVNYMAFENAFKGSPCVLVSAGPSLNKNVHLLKEIKGKFPIVCVYTAYKVLQKNGIEPDFIISVDSNQTCLESEEVKNEPINVPLFCSLISDPLLLEKHKGQKIFFVSSLTPVLHQIFIDLKKPVRVISSGGSVACSALDLLVFMGADPVIFIGQDMAFTGKKTHADGTFYGDDTGLKDDAKYLVTVEDVYGNEVITNKPYLSFKTWFDGYIREKNGEISFIDATEGGAKILGTEIMTFKEAIGQNFEKSVDVEKISNKIFANNPLFIGKENFEYLGILKKMEDSFESIEEILSKGIKTCKKMIKIYEKNE